MEKRIIEIELFVEQNLICESGKNENDVYFGCSQAQAETYSTNYSSVIEGQQAYRNNNIAMYEPKVITSLLESELTNELKYILEIRPQCKILDESAKKRLSELGFNEIEANEQSSDKKDQVFACIICDNKLFYDLSSVEEYIDNYSKEMVIELRNKETLYFIKNENYRKWLMDWRHIHYDDIIISAPIDISEKIKMLHGIEEDEVGRRRRWPDHCTEALLRYEAALKLISDNSSISAYVLHENIRLNEDRRSVIKEKVSTHRTFQQVREAIVEKYHGKEPDEFSNCWNTVVRFDLKDGNYVQIAKFLVSEKGNIWHVECENKNFNWYSRPSFTDLDLPVPFKSGDIVTIDRRPFNESYHILIINGEIQEYTYSPFCLRKTENGMEMLHCEFFEEDFYGISPFFSMELYEGELPEEERILGEVGKRIKEDKDFYSTLHRVIDLNKPEEAEKILWELLTE